MKELIERLRKLYVNAKPGFYPSETVLEAADALEQMQADNERLRDKAKKAYEKGVKDALAAVQEGDDV